MGLAAASATGLAVAPLLATSAATCALDVCRAEAAGAGDTVESGRSDGPNVSGRLSGASSPPAACGAKGAAEIVACRRTVTGDGCGWAAWKIGNRPTIPADWGDDGPASSSGWAGRGAGDRCTVAAFGRAVPWSALSSGRFGAGLDNSGMASETACSKGVTICAGETGGGSAVTVGGICGSGSRVARWIGSSA